MSNSIKTSKNYVSVAGVRYYTACYFKNVKKNFNRNSFVRIADQSYYLPV